MNKLIVILGPTASGKTALSIKLARKYNGEIISADSRQVYKGMDIGSGKITKKEMQGIPHHLLDVANPKRKFTVAQWRNLAQKAVKKIHKKGKLPFLVGGTAFYINALLGDISIPGVKPDWKLRKQLEKLTTEQLFKKLRKLDPKRAADIDKNNPRRLIRALEIVLKTKKPVPTLVLEGQAPQFSVLEIGITKSPEELKKLIKKRLLKRLKIVFAEVRPPQTCGGLTSANLNSAPLIKEVKKLRKSGLSWQRLEEFGLEYRFVAQYLQNKIAYQEMIDKIQKESEHFVKKQMIWFKRDKRIKWTKNYKKAAYLIDRFIEK